MRARGVTWSVFLPAEIANAEISTFVWREKYRAPGEREILKGCTAFRPSKLRTGVLMVEQPHVCQMPEPCD
jgi:hypothetical protein